MAAVQPEPWLRTLITNNNMVRYQVKVRIALEQTTKAQRGSTGIAVLFL
jgi:hypothetical protein